MIEETPAQRQQVRQYATWLSCMIGGIVLVLFSQSLGQIQATRYSDAGHYSFSPDDAHINATIIQILGMMAFAAGLVERIIMGIRFRA